MRDAGEYAPILAGADTVVGARFLSRAHKRRRLRSCQLSSALQRHSRIISRIAEMRVRKRRTIAGCEALIAEVKALLRAIPYNPVDAMSSLSRLKALHRRTLLQQSAEDRLLAAAAADWRQLHQSLFTRGGQRGFVLLSVACFVDPAQSIVLLELVCASVQ